MTPAADIHRSHRRLSWALALALPLAGFATAAVGGEPVGPDFSKEFMPDTIGPDSTAMLIFTIDNSEGSEPVSDLAFSDTLPDDMTLASPAFVSNTCLLDIAGSLSAPDGGDTISLSGGLLGAGETCEIVVNVTAVAVDASDTTYMNVSGDLTSSAGNSGPASDDLVVMIDRPGFSKAFSTDPPTDPPTVELGGRSTLTFTIDNSLNALPAAAMFFTDTFPPGMVVADPANAGTTCDFVGSPVVTAVPGAGFVSLSSGAVAGSGTCTVTVDVVGGSVGELGNVSAELFATVLAVQKNCGKAAAVLEVTGFETPLVLEKEFTDDPVAPGGTVTLEFTITNQDRFDSATSITFDDDLDTTLSGLTATPPPTPDPPCGGGSTLGFSMGVLTLTGGSLPPEGSCTFSVPLTVDAMSSPGAYPNTTSEIEGDVGGSPVTGNAAGDILFVVDFPVLTKEFTDDPVASGGTVTLEFTITNPSTSAMSDITFLDELTDGSGGFPPDPTSGFLPFPVSVDLPPSPDPPCGGSSSLALVSAGTDRQALELTGGSLEANDGMPGGPDECAFSVTVDIPTALPGGIYTNTTETISALLDGEEPVIGPPASDTVVVAGAPTLTKEFTDDPVLPSGGSVTVEFTLSYDVEEGTPDATMIAFTDDLTTVFAGLVATALGPNSCAGSTVDITTLDTLIDFSGGSLAAGESCSFTVTLTVPVGAPVGFHTNATSDVTADVDGVMASNNPGEDDLLVTPLVFSKEFTDDPVIAGDTATLEFTIDNTLGGTDATGVSFSDVLSDAVPGMTWTASSTPTPCGGTPVGIGTGTFTLLGGTVTAGTSCVFTIDVLVPPGTGDDGYLNVTGSLSSSLGSAPPATDVLFVESTLLELTKEFTDDPVFPEDPVTLVFTLENLSATETITDIEFSDDLDAALTGLIATSVDSNTCSGSTVDISDPTEIVFSGGTLGPSASCTIELTLEVPPGPLPGSSFLNTTSGLTGRTDLCPDIMPMAAGSSALYGPPCVFGEPASDTLEVRLLSFEKSFDGPTVPTGTAVLTFTLTNLDSVNDATGLAFSDDLDAVVSGLEAVLPPTPDPPCGMGSVAAGTSFLTVTNATVPAGGSCSFDVTVSVPDGAPAGDFLNTTSDLFQSGIPAAAPATAFLTVEPPPAFSKEFSPDTIGVDEVSTLTFTIDNTASALAATDLAFTDTLPAGVVVATPSNATTDCTGGTLIAVSGSGTISYSGGTVAAVASCTVSVDVTSDTAGEYVNVSDDLTSSSGTSGTATDTLTVEVAEADLELVKTDLFEPVMSGRYQLYLLTVTNLGPGDAEEVVLTDVLPAGVVPVIIDPASDCSEAGGVVTCAVGDLAAGDDFFLGVLAYVELSEMPAPLDNLATVTSDTDDPDLGNNDVLESTEVIPLAGVAALADGDGDGSFEVGVPVEGSIEVLVKSTAAPFVTLHQTEVFPDGWALAGFEKKPGVNGARDDVVVLAVEIATGAAVAQVVAGPDGTLGAAMVVPTPFLPLAMTVIADEASGTTSVVIVARRTDTGSNRAFVFDATTGALTATIPLNPAVWPIDVAAVESFGGGDTLPELAFLVVKTSTGAFRLQVKELTGALMNIQNLPDELLATAVTGLPNCCALPAPEVAVLGWDFDTGKVRVRTVDADSGALVSDEAFAGNAKPAAVASVADFADTTADEVVALYRNGVDRAAARMRDAASGAQLFLGGFGPTTGSIPLGLAISEDDVVVYWEDATSGVRMVTVKDGMTGAVVVKVPIP